MEKDVREVPSESEADAAPSLEKNDLLRLLVAERYSLLAFINSICRDRDLAEDVFQNLVVITSEKRPSVTSREHFLSWARTAARFEVRNLARKQRRTITLEEGVMDSLKIHWDNADRNRGPLQAEALERCVGRLTPNARHMLQQRFEAGLTGDSLARALNRKTSAVHVALSRAYRFLAECIGRNSSSNGGGLGKPVL